MCQNIQYMVLIVSNLMIFINIAEVFKMQWNCSVNYWRKENLYANETMQVLELL